MATFIGTPGDDSEIGTTDADDYRGAGGDDTFSGGFNRDSLSGEADNDTLDGGRQDDTVDGGAGDDVLRGGSGDDNLVGGTGVDTQVGGSGDDRFVFIGGFADGAGDRVDGGLGFDTLVVDFSSPNAVLGDAVTFTGADPLTTLTLEGDLQIKNVERYDFTGTIFVDEMTGGRWEDHFDGGQGGDVLRGGAGSDTLEGGLDDDILEGGGDADYLRGDEGSDTLRGGNGADTIRIVFADEGQDTIDGGRSSNDRLWIDDVEGTFTAKAPTVENTLADGTTVINVESYLIQASDGDDKITTLGGNDYILTGDGSDRVSAGRGNDVVWSGGTGADTIDAGAGEDYVLADRNSNTTGVTFTMNGSTGLLNDGTRITNAETISVNGGSGADSLTGGDGVQNLDGGLGNDTIKGGAGNDYLTDSGGNNRLDGGSGDDYVSVTVYDSHPGGDTSTVRLGTGDDSGYVGGKFGAFAVDGGSGTDNLTISRSSATADLTYVHSANATLVNGNVTVKNIESVSLYGGEGSDTFTGGAGNDYFDGGSGAGRDVLNGGAGNDTLGIRDGDRANGGAGTDYADIDLSRLDVGVSFTLTSGTVKINGTTRLSSIEAMDFTGTSAADLVTGGSRADRLEDGGGSDVLDGGGGDDVLVRSQPSTTTLQSDDFSGGDGRDTLQFDNASSSSVVLDLADQGRNDGLARGLTVSGFEIYDGTYYDDDLRGNGAGQALYGSDGDDVLDGRGGNDTLTGGAGGDLLTGGSGKDRFVYGYGEGGTGDRITDFKSGTDKLVIENLASLGGNDNDYRFLTKADTVNLISGTEIRATGSKPQFFFETDTSRLWFDADGAGTEHEATLMVTLTGVTSLTANDFIINDALL